jgi:hypothetical protein
MARPALLRCNIITRRLFHLQSSSEVILVFPERIITGAAYDFVTVNHGRNYLAPNRPCPKPWAKYFLPMDMIVFTYDDANARGNGKLLTNFELS